MESSDKHPTYTIVKDSKEADAVGWGFYTPDVKKMEKIYFKFPELGDDELRIKTHYAGLCYSEVHTVSGDWGPMTTKPIIPGHEIAGEVEKIGANVKDFKVGDKVGFGCYRDFCEQCKYCKRGDDNFCSGPLKQKYTYGPFYWGGYATHVQHPAKLFFKIPDTLDLGKVAPLFCAGVTLYNPISKYAKKGDNIAITGLGGLGHMGVKYGKAWGCHVTVFTTSKDKIQLCKDLGADEVVVTKEEGAFKKNAGKYDVVLNTIHDLDQQMFDDYTSLIAPQGTFVQLGAPMTEIKWKMGTLVFNEAKFVGSQVGPKHTVQEMLEFSAKHNILPMVEEFSFEDFPKAWDKLINGKPFFRCVVKTLGGK